MLCVSRIAGAWQNRPRLVVLVGLLPVRLLQSMRRPQRIGKTPARKIQYLADIRTGFLGGAPRRRYPASIHKSPR